MRESAGDSLAGHHPQTTFSADGAPGNLTTSGRSPALGSSRSRSPIPKESAVEPEQPKEAAAERELFETIKATYALADEPEQRAMIKELRSHLPTIPSAERMALIDEIE